MGKILVIDDTQEYIEMLEDILSEYEVFGENDGLLGIKLAKEILPDIILLDINMPGLNGYEVCRYLKLDKKLKNIPVIFLTANDSNEFEEIGFEVGAVDYVSKPFNSVLLKARIKTHINLFTLQSNLQHEVDNRVNEIKKLNQEMILVTASIAEMKSKETGLHIKRVSKLSYKMAKFLGKSEHESQMIEMSAVLHDIGKVGIPDEILHKAGKLNKEEWEVMKTHSTLGYEILSKSEFEILRFASTISLEHHERWDGTGYPKGLKKHEISFIGRLVSVIDVFDSLLDERVYKEPWSNEDVREYFKEMRGTQFDPHITDMLLNNFDEFIDERDLLRELV